MRVRAEAKLPELSERTRTAAEVTQAKLAGDPHFSWRRVVFHLLGWLLFCLLVGLRLSPLFFLAFLVFFVVITACRFFLVLLRLPKAVGFWILFRHPFLG